MKLTVSRVIVISSYLLTCISDYYCTTIVIYAHARIYNKLHPLSGSFRCSVEWSIGRVESSPLAAVSGERGRRGHRHRIDEGGGSRVQVMATDPAVVFQVSNLG